MPFLSLYSQDNTDWNDVTVEQVLDGSRDSDPIWIYGAVKTIAEQQLWKFADEHPEIDITTSMLYYFIRFLRQYPYL